MIKNVHGTLFLFLLSGYVGLTGKPGMGMSKGMSIRHHTQVPGEYSQLKSPKTADAEVAKKKHFVCASPVD